MNGKSTLMKSLLATWLPVLVLTVSGQAVAESRTARVNTLLCGDCSIETKSEKPEDGSENFDKLEIFVGPIQISSTNDVLKTQEVAAYFETEFSERESAKIFNKFSGFVDLRHAEFNPGEPVSGSPGPSREATSARADVGLLFHYTERIWLKLGLGVTTRKSKEEGVNLDARFFVGPLFQGAYREANGTLFVGVAYDDYWSTVNHGKQSRWSIDGVLSSRENKLGSSIGIRATFDAELMGSGPSDFRVAVYVKQDLKKIKALFDE